MFNSMKTPESNRRRSNEVNGLLKKSLSPRITSTPLNSLPMNNRRSQSFSSPLRHKKHCLQDVIASPNQYLNSIGSLRMKQIQNTIGPLLTSAQHNINLSTYVDSKSPGYAGRVVQYSEEKERPLPTHQTKYGSPGMFPIVHLNKKDLPIVSPKSRRVTLRISSDPVNINDSSRLLFSSDNSTLNASEVSNHSSDTSTRSVLDALKEISRKRIHPGEEYEAGDDTAKRYRPDCFGDGDVSRRLLNDSPSSESQPDSIKKICVVNPFFASETSSLREKSRQKNSDPKNTDVEEQIAKPAKVSVNVETQTVFENDVEKIPEKKKEEVHEKDKKIETEPKQKEEPQKEEKKVKQKHEAPLRIFDEKPLEILRKNRLATLLGALTGEEPVLLEKEDKLAKFREETEEKVEESVKSPLKSILTQEKKTESSPKHVTFSLPSKEPEVTSQFLIPKCSPSITQTSASIVSPIMSSFVYDSPKSSTLTSMCSTSTPLQVASAQPQSFNIGNSVQSKSSEEQEKLSKSPTILSNIILSPTATVAEKTSTSLSISNATPQLTFGSPITKAPSFSEGFSQSTPVPQKMSEQKIGGFKFDLATPVTKAAESASEVGLKTPTFFTGKEMSTVKETIKGGFNFTVSTATSNVSQNPETSVSNSDVKHLFSNVNFKSTASEDANNSPFNAGTSQEISQAGVSSPASTKSVFGAANTVSTPSTSGFSFITASTATGSTSASSQSAAALISSFKPQPTFGNVGATATSSQAPSTTKMTFGVPPANSTSFLSFPNNPVPSTATSSSTPAAFSFGNKTSVAPPATNNNNVASAASTTFGTSSSTTSSAPVFGAPISNATPSSKPAFGTTTSFKFPFTVSSSNVQTPSTNVFGAAASTVQTPSTNVFGAPSSTTSTVQTPSTNVFGAPSSSASTVQTPSTNVFGAPSSSASTVQTPSTNVFGAPSSTASTVQTPSTNVFAASSSTTMFAPSNTSGNNIFNTTTTPSFGSTSQANPAGNSAPMFPSTNSSNVFGTAAPAFGVNNGVSTNSSFPNPTPNFVTTPSTFGSSGMPFCSTTKSPFGAVTTASPFSSTPPSTTSTFGVPSTSAFSFGSTGNTAGSGTFGSVQPTTTSAFSFGSGGNTTVSSNFGAAQPTAVPSFPFGSAAVTTTASTFGSATPIFGSNTTNSTFGNSNNNPSFGVTNNNSFGNTPVFKPNNMFTSNNQPSFGSLPNTITPTFNPVTTASTPSIFGASTTPAFGSNNKESTGNTGFPSSSGFESNPTFGSGFGTTDLNKPQGFGSPNMFGNTSGITFGNPQSNTATTNPSATGGEFMFNSVSTQPAGGFSFGSVEPPKPSFNFASPSSTPAFGTVQNPTFGAAPPNVMPFGAPQNQFSASPGMFNIGSGSATSTKSRTHLKGRRRT